MPDPTPPAGGANQLPTPTPPTPTPPAEPTPPTPPPTPPAEPGTPPAEPGTPPADPGTPPAEPGKGGKTAEERIQDLIAQRNVTQEYAEYWREQALLARQGAMPPSPGQPSPPAAEQPKPRPKRADFETDQAYEEAQTKWQDDEIDRRVNSAVEKKTTATREQAAAAEREAAWNSRCSKFAADHPEFYTAIANPRLPFTKTMTAVVMDSENGPAVAMHLATNPAEATRIARLSTTAQAAALGRLEAEITGKPPSGEPTPPPTPPPPTPPPPSPITGHQSPAINLETCSLEEFKAARIPGYKAKAS